MICTEAGQCHPLHWAPTTCQMSPLPHTGAYIAFTSRELSRLLWFLYFPGICLQPHLSIFAPPPPISFNQDHLRPILPTCLLLHIMIGKSLSSTKIRLSKFCPTWDSFSKALLTYTAVKNKPFKKYSYFLPDKPQPSSRSPTHSWSSAFRGGWQNRLTNNWKMVPADTVVCIIHLAGDNF